MKVVDVKGLGLSLDTSREPIYEPYPTTALCGYDLDAVVANRSHYIEYTR